MSESMPTEHLEGTPQGGSLSFWETVQVKIAYICIRRTALWKDIKQFGHWWEFEAVRMAQQERQTLIRFEIGPRGAVQNFRIGVKKHPHTLERFPKLWEFLQRLKMREVRLDVRLERNQIEDILALLYSQRRRLVRDESERGSPKGVCDRIRHQGIHFACTDTSVHGETLSITYSYCTLRFSRGIRWFEKIHTKFRDHRAMFYAAPRYAIVVGLLVIGPMIAYAIHYHSRFLLVLSLLSTLILSGLVYLFFMIVGSVEYDNEEQAYRLGKAYEELQLYTQRIKADIRRAQIVQEKFLPDFSHMPLAQHVTWGSSFDPAEEVGGDYFDVHVFTDNRVAVLFSDVSGHGMAAAFITAILKTTFQEWVDDKGTLEELIQQLNTSLYRLTPFESFAGVFVALYNSSTGELEYANGGHHPEPWYIPAAADNGISPLSGARNLILGIEEDVSYTVARQHMQPGDMVLMVSDGIIENQNVDNEQYGVEPFEDLLRNQRNLPVAELVEAIAREARAFSQDAEQSDDRTILAFQVKTPNETLQIDKPDG